MGVIFWFIFIVWIVLAISKSKGQSKGQSTGQSTGNKKTSGTTQSRMSENPMKQQELKERLSKKYNKYVGNPEGEILKRAKASVAEDFSTSGYAAAGTSGGGIEGSVPKTAVDRIEFENRNYADAQSRQKDIDRLVAEKLAVTERLETERYQQNHVLQTVEDLMIKGPDTNLTFERDFLAEGMDMLNRIQGS